MYMYMYILSLEFELFVDFLAGTSQQISSSEVGGSVFGAFRPVLAEAEQRLKEVKFGSRASLVHVDLLQMFTTNEPLAKVVKTKV